MTNSDITPGERASLKIKRVFLFYTVRVLCTGLRAAPVNVAFPTILIVKRSKLDTVQHLSSFMVRGGPQLEGKLSICNDDPRLYNSVSPFQIIGQAMAKRTTAQLQLIYCTSAGARLIPSVSSQNWKITAPATLAVARTSGYTPYGLYIRSRGAVPSK